MTCTILDSICARLTFRRVPARISLSIVFGFGLLSAASLCALQAGAQNSSPDFVTVQACEVTPGLVAYGRIEPIVVVSVSAGESGVVSNLRVRPGTRVHAGEPLARLGGPAIASLLLQSEADLRSASAQLDAAENSLAIEKRQLSTHLATRQAVQQAESAEAQARAALDNARSRFHSVRQLMIVAAPANGVVLALNSADGAWAGVGQTILTLQPDGGLWLRAMYYGENLAAIHVGMRGSFAPSAGGREIPVRVVAMPGVLAAGGGESIALEPIAAHSSWLSGEAGTVTLRLPRRSVVEVPTRALIVNRGKWWVLVHTPRGNHAQEVVRGAAEGWNTVVESGLRPGTEVVVKNAYLLFHSGIAEQYQNPD